MDVRVEGEIVEVAMTPDEAQRLCFAVQEGYVGISRAEYFIRTGLSKPAIETLVHAMSAVVDKRSGEVTLALEPGIEEIENPRRPRPSS
ncbi:hypothetical protein [Kribbella sp. C-35]|uniref:hypothetical protein n=1 Tax=Kribbella sp. C-35 TaxID=2789276 RepID=UPI003978A023